MAQQNPGQSPAPLIKPSSIDNIPIFSAEQKAHYKHGLTALWQQLESAPQGSQQHRDAESKIRNASVKIMQQISKGNRSATVAAPGPQQQPQRPSTGGQAAMAQNGATQQGQPQASGGQPPQQQPSQPPQANPMNLTQAHQNELRQVKINIPPQISQQGNDASRQYVAAMMKRGAQTLQRREQIMAKGRSLQQQQQNLQRNGQPVPQQITTELNECKTLMQKINQEWEQFKQHNANQAQGMQRQGSTGGQQQPNTAQQPQQMQRSGSMQGAQQVPPQGDVKMNMDGSTVSPPQPQGTFQPQPSQVASVRPQQNMPQQASATQIPQQQQQPQQQTPQTATQPTMPQNVSQQQRPMQQPGQQQQAPQRPPMNAQQMAAAQQQNLQHQQQTPTSAVSQSAQQQQQQQQRPQPLTHQAAISQAQASYGQQQQPGQLQPQPQQPGNPSQHLQSQGQVPQGAAAGVSLNGPHANQPTPQNAYPQMPPQTQQSSSQTKFPIPKQLQLDPRTQQPVAGPPARPTYSNAGMLAQPGVQRPAQFTLEGEGDRVLSKRKLDELVRQVTGSSGGLSSEASEDGSGGALAPDVEESILTLADDFVDAVITSACRLAKLRGTQTLDLRDIQIVLERNYGIRIPGYGLDEVRTVRKFQPAPGWQSKMQAIQAGKVMSSREN